MPAAQTLRFLLGPIELLHEHAGPRLLRLTRLGVFALWIVKLLLDPLWRLADLPREMYRPVGLLALLSPEQTDWLLSEHGLSRLLAFTFFACVLCLHRQGFAITSTIAAVLLTIYSSVIRGFGPAVHTDIVLLLAVYALAGFAWADLWQAKFGRGPRNAAAWARYPLITIVALLCLSYMLVGFNRTFMGGPTIFLGDTMETWAIDASLRGYYFNTNVGWHLPEWPFVAFMIKAGLPVITFFEIAAPFCLVSSHFRWVFIPVMFSFHLLSLVFMNIFFFDDMFIYLLLIDWSRRFPAMRYKAG